jgi:hypothetical protein
MSTEYVKQWPHLGNILTRIKIVFEVYCQEEIVWSVETLMLSVVSTDEALTFEQNNYLHIVTANMNLFCKI